MKKLEFVKKIIVVVFLLVISGGVFYLAPNYDMGDKYTKDEIRVVIDDKEITKKLPDKAVLIDGEVLLSKDTIDIWFDKYIMLDEKYDTVITTSDDKVAKLKLNENSIEINGEEKTIKVPAQIIEEKVYIPIGMLEDVYDIKVTYNQKLVISKNSTPSILATIGYPTKLHKYKKVFCYTVADIELNDKVTIYNYDDDKDWVFARTETGELGYIKASQLVVSNTETKLVDELETKPAKVNLIWDYAENYTVDRSGQDKISGIDVVSPTWLYVKNDNGDIKNTVDESYISWAKSKGYKIWPTLKNDNMGLNATSTIVNDMLKRDNLISQVVETAKRYGVDGVNIDFEYMKKEDASMFSQFVRELSAILRANNITPTVDITVPDGSENWSLCYDRDSLAEATDYIILMAYDQYGSGGKKVGTVAGFDWVEKNIKKLINNEEIPSEKIILGVPFYSRVWITNGNNISAQSIYMNNTKQYLERYKDNTTWLENEKQFYIEYQLGNTKYQIWAEEEKSIAEKLKLIEEYNLAGAAYWRWGYESDSVWKVISK